MNTNLTSLNSVLQKLQDASGTGNGEKGIKQSIISALHNLTVPSERQEALMTSVTNRFLPIANRLVEDGLAESDIVDIFQQTMQYALNTAPEKLLQEPVGISGMFVSLTNAVVEKSYDKLDDESKQKIATTLLNILNANPDLMARIQFADPQQKEILMEVILWTTACEQQSRK